MIQYFSDNKETDDLDLNPGYLGGFENVEKAVKEVIAQAIAAWPETQLKAFLITLSQLDRCDGKGIVRMDKNNFISSLGLNRYKDQDLLKRTLIDMQGGTNIELQGDKSGEIEYGRLIRAVASDRDRVIVQFEETYLPVLLYVAELFFIGKNYPWN